MSVQPLEPGLSPEKQAVVTKKDLINGVMASLKDNQPDQAAKLYRRCKEDVGYELVNLVSRGPLAKPLAGVFLQAKDYYKAAQVFESLEMKKEAAENFAKGETSARPPTCTDSWAMSPSVPRCSSGAAPMAGPRLCLRRRVGGRMPAEPTSWRKRGS